jgi:hypothetical protein
MSFLGKAIIDSEMPLKVESTKKLFFSLFTDNESEKMQPSLDVFPLTFKSLILLLIKTINSKLVVRMKYSL